MIIKRRRIIFLILLYVFMFGLLFAAGQDENPKAPGLHTGIKTMVQFDSNKDGSLSAFIFEYNPEGSIPGSGAIAVREGKESFPLDKIKELKKNKPSFFMGYFILDYEVLDNAKTNEFGNYAGKVLKAVAYTPEGKKSWYEVWFPKY